MKSPARNCSPKHRRWAHVNTPDGLRRRQAKADARREERSATLPSVYAGPAPLSAWQTVHVLQFDAYCAARQARPPGLNLPATICRASRAVQRPAPDAQPSPVFGAGSTAGRIDPVAPLAPPPPPPRAWPAPPSLAYRGAVAQPQQPAAPSAAPVSSSAGPWPQRWRCACPRSQAAARPGRGLPACRSLA